jgi:hypothetical protein
MQSRSVWPTTVAGWLSFITGSLVLTGILGSGLSWWLRVKLNGLGKRVAKVEGNCSEHGRAVEDLEKTQGLMKLGNDNLSGRVGEIKGIAEALTSTMNANNSEAFKEARRTGERMARIEQALGIPPQRDG